MSLAGRAGSAARAYAGLDRRIWTLAAVRGANTMGLSLVLAFMGLYLVTERGVSGLHYGLIYFTANICQAATSTWAGQLSDRIGRRGLMVSTLVGRALVIATLGALVLVHAPVPLLAVVIVVSATLRGGFEPIASAVVADIARPADRVAAFGLQRIGINAGWAVGPALGGLLASVIDYGLVFFCAVIPLFISAIVMARLEEPPRDTAAPAADRISLRAALADASSRGELMLLLLCALVFSTVHIQLFATLGLYAKGELGIDEAHIGLLYTINGVLVIALQVPAIALIRRLSPDRALVTGCLIYSTAFLWIGAADGPGLLRLAVVTATIGEVILTPAQESTVADLSDPARLGRAFGLYGTMQMIGVAFAPLLGGLIYDHLRHRPMAMWGTLAGLAFLLALGYARFGSLNRRRLQGDISSGR
ncbi:MAG TPA: MFS transporter [Kofleriaceae bacterium]